MAFSSYAHDFEDVLLWRVLGKFGPGFYIDMGAVDPENNSVTKAFYDAGWNGINISEEQAVCDQFKNARGKDVNLSGLSSKGFSLAQVCVEYAQGKDIHFLRINSKGNEQSILKQADFDNYRPWVIVVNAAEPSTTKPAYLKWEPVLEKALYAYVYSEGENRFYVAQEKLDFLKQHFVSPLNWFEYFERTQLKALSNDVVQLNKELAACQQELYELTRTNEFLRKEIMNFHDPKHRVRSLVHGMRDGLRVLRRKVKNK